MINPWIILGLVLSIIAAFGGGYYKGNEDGQASVQQKWDKENARLQAEYAENQRLAREREQALALGAERLRQEKDREIRNINARATALTNSLRDRSERPAQSSAVSGTTPACSGATGKELARGDGEFLARYAADAARNAAALDQCIRQYEDVRNRK
jgi:hypothetical protein